MLLWFPKHKGLAAAVSIVSFGLGSTLCTWFAKMLLGPFSLSKFFSLIMGIYCVMMNMGAWLIKKPEIEQKNDSNAVVPFSYL